MSTQETPSPQPQSLEPAASEPTREERLYPDDQPKAETSEEKPRSSEGRSTEDATKEKPHAQQQPKAYELKLTTKNEAGEDTEVPLDPALVEAATPVFKEAGLSQDQANKLLPLVPQVHERFYRQQLDAFDAMKADWARDLKADPEIGGKNLQETTRLAGVVLKAGGADSGDHEVRQLLNQSGLGNHPAMARFFRTLGKVIMQGQSANAPALSAIEAARDNHQKSIYPDDPPRGFGKKLGPSAAEPRSRSERLYPDEQPKP